MIRRCAEGDFEQIYTIINDGALAYKGVIPDDCWAQPHMSRHELQYEMDAGVFFRGWEDKEALHGVMRLQGAQDVVLIRHAYVTTQKQQQGIGRTCFSICGTWQMLRFSSAPGRMLVGRSGFTRKMGSG